MPSGDDAAAPDAPLRASTLELFFDLVFAFTLTQLSTLLAAHGIARWPCRRRCGGSTSASTTTSGR